MKKASVIMVFALLFSLGIVSANEDSDTTLKFPSWTYWAEIIEHAAITLIAVVAIFYLLALHTDKKTKTTNIMIFGLVLLALSQLLTNLHHFLIYPFGELTAVIHHGLLSISIMIIVYAYIKK